MTRRGCEKRLLGSMIIILLMGFSAPQTGAQDTAFNKMITQALANNTGVQKSLSDLEIAHATVEKTYAMFDWKLYGGVTYSESDSDPSSLFAPAGVDVMSYQMSLSEKMVTAGILSLDFTSARTSTLYGEELSAFFTQVNPTYQPELSISYTQPLLKDFLGRPDRIALQIADYSVRMSENGVRSTVADQVEKLVEAYYFIDMAEKILKVQKVSLAESEEYYRQTQRMKKIGLRENTDLLQTRASMLSAQAEIKPAENNVALAQDQFLMLAGFTTAEWEGMRPKQEDDLAAGDVPEVLTTEKENRLIDRQFPVVMSAMSVEMAKLDKRIAENTRWPALNVFGKYGMAGVDNDAGRSLSEMFSNEYNNFAVGMNFTMFFPNRSSSGDIKTTAQELAKTQKQYEELKRAMRLQIRQAHRVLLAAKQDYQLKLEARELYEKTLDIQNRHFSQGRISTRELLMAQSDLHRAQFSEISAFYEFVKAVNAWKKITGAYDAYAQALIKE